MAQLITTRAPLEERAEWPLVIINWARKSADAITAVFFLTFITTFGMIVVWRQGTETPFTAMLWALACLAAGGLIGFIFGIPRVLQGDNPASANTDPASSSSPDNASAQAARRAAYDQRVNTNLEQISDWLTKILVGVGLINIGKISSDLGKASVYLAQGFGKGQEPFAAALIIYFSVVGFLSGYMLTRLWLAAAFSRADRGAMERSSGEALRRADQQIPPPSLAPGPGNGGGKSPLAPSQPGSAVSEVVALRLNQLTTPREIAIWAKTQVSQRNYEEAVNGYSKAVALAPDDIDLRLEYAAALHYAGRPPQKVREQLLEALTRLRNQSGADENLKMKVYRSLTFQSLFISPPEGFSDAIRYGEEYVNELGGKAVEAAIAINLAAAYGQKYKWLQQQSADTKESENAKELGNARAASLKYVKAAISANGKSKERILQLLLKNYPNKNPDDDDLEVFEHDKEFRAAVDLEPC